MLQTFYKRFRDYMHQPAFYFSRPWLVILFNVIIPLSMMGLYEPFGYRLNSISQFQVLLGYMLTVFVTSILFFILIPLICRNYYQPDRWTIGKNWKHAFLFLLVTFICVFIYDYHYLGGHAWGDYLTNKHFSNHCYMVFLAVFAIGIFPLSISYLIEKSYQLKQSLAEIKQMNQKLRSVISKQVDPVNIIRLSGDTKESLQVNPERILYIESSGNYVDVHYLEDDKLMHKMIRSTIKQIEEQLCNYDYLLRCHRAFIVNVHAIVHIEGNAQSYRLTLRDCEEEIPVSRTYLKLLKASLA